MHQYLRVPEIAAAIAEACALDYRDAGSFGNGSKPKLGAVYALARTCRALHGPALDVLWYYQFGLQNLVKCLPTGLWRIWNKRERDAFDEWGKVVERDWCHELQINASRGITPQGWERFDLYAQRVRKLECHQDYVARGNMPKWYYAEPTRSVIRTLRELKGSPLLPNLQSVHWTAKDIAGPSFDTLRSLFTANLTSLDLVCVRSGERLPEDVLIALAVHCPRLQRFHLQIPLDILDTDSLSSVLRYHLSALPQFAFTIKGKDSHVHPFIVKPNHLSALESFSNLCELRLVKGSYVRDENITVSCTFPSIKVLHLDSNDVPSARRIFEDCTFPSLTDISVLYRESTPMSHPERETQLLALIISKISHSVLHTFDMRYIGGPETTWTNNNTPKDVDISELDQLFVFPNLRHLSFRLGPGLNIVLTDADLGAFAHTWPHLRTLHIGNERESHDPSAPRPTFRGLAPLIQLCPDLTTLSLDIAPTPTLGPDDLEDLPTSTQNMSLGFCYSPMGDLESAASWMAKMFPCSGPTSQDPSSAWAPQRWALYPAVPPPPDWFSVFLLARRKANRARALIDK